MNTLSLRARLTLYYTVALLVVLSLSSAVVLWQQGRLGLQRVDRQLSDVTATTESLMRDELNEDPVLSSASQEVLGTVAAPGRAIGILDATGRPFATEWNGLDLAMPWPTARDGSRTWTTGTAEGEWRVHAQPASIDEKTLVLIAATPLSDVLRERSEVQQAMWVGIPLVLLLAGTGGMWLASVVLRPITDMARRAGEIPLAGIQDLGESDRTDELGQLARAFNDLVARLRTALQTQRQFMADASHELRTPVSVIRSAAEVTLTRPQREEPEYREALSIVAGEARRVGRLVEDMLVLARADAGGYPLQRVTLYLDEIVTECRRTLDVLASERGVTVQVAPLLELAYIGDEDLLRRMLLNIIQNGIQHTPSGGSVGITVSKVNGAVVIDVADQGPGIRSEDHERIFDRFVQLDPSRRGSGTGLGLPIARWIAQAHGGSLTVESSSASGSIFRVRLPLPS